MSEPTKMEKFLQHIEETYGLENTEGVYLAVRELKRDDVNEMAVRWVQQCIAKKLRTETLKIERASSSTAVEMHETPVVKRKTVGGRTSTPDNWKNPNYMGKREWEEFTKSPEFPEWEVRERELQQRLDECNRRLWDKLEDNLRIYTEEMRVQWTQELLDSQFNMPDGTTVTWGTATREQHEARYEMFKNNAMANMEGAARHKQAMQQIDSAGVTTLLELTSAVAA